MIIQGDEIYYAVNNIKFPVALKDPDINDKGVYPFAFVKESSDKVIVMKGSKVYQN